VIAILLTVCTPFITRFLTTLLAVNAYVVPVTVFNKLKLIEFASVNAPVLIVFVTPVPVVTHSTKGVPATVKLVTVLVFQIVLVVALVNTILPVPKFIVRALLFVLANNPLDKAKVLNAKVPAVRVNVLPNPKVKLLKRVCVPAAPFCVMLQLNVVPPLSIVLVVVPVSVIVPVLFHVVVPGVKAIFPAIDNVGDVPVAKVTVPALTVIFKQFNAPVIVTVYVAA